MTTIDRPRTLGYRLFFLRHGEGVSESAVIALWWAISPNERATYERDAASLDRDSRRDVSTDLRAYAALHTDATWRAALHAAAERAEVRDVR